MDFCDTAPGGLPARARRPHRAARALTLAVALAGVALTALSTAAFAGAWWWPLDLLASFRPQLSAALGLAAVWLAAARHGRTACAVGVGAGINALLVGALWVPPAGSTPPGPAERIRVLSFNVLAGNERFEEVRELVRRTSPDVVFLHEAGARWAERFEAPQLGYRVLQSRDPRHATTIALIPREADVSALRFTQHGPRAVEVHVQKPSGGRLALLGIHPPAPSSERRAAVRDAQLAFAARWAAQRSGPRAIAGDLNATPWSHAFRRLVTAGGLVDSQRGFGLQPSFPSWFPPALRIPIDHLLASPDVSVSWRTLGPPAGSDHLPLIADLWVPIAPRSLALRELCAAGSGDGDSTPSAPARAPPPCSGSGSGSGSGRD